MTAFCDSRTRFKGNAEALVLGDTFARMRRAADYPQGLSEIDADRRE